MSENKSNIQWFPGHMTKTRRMMEEDIKLVDLVMEVVDSRIPYSSKNPYLDKLWNKRPRIMAINKSDLASPEATAKWKAWYESQGFGVVVLDSMKGKGFADIPKEAEKLFQEKRERDLKRGIKNRPIRMMVTGIPNVGKSTVINQLAGRSGAAKTGNKPGVTRGKQWIKIKGNMEMMDTPGMLWPKFEDQELGMKIAFIGSIKDEILDIDEICYRLMPYVVKLSPEILKERFRLTDEDLALPTVELIELIGDHRGHKISGGQVDFSRTARMLVDEFRKGTLGRMTLELPEDLPEKE